MQSLVLPTTPWGLILFPYPNPQSEFSFYGETFQHLFCNPTGQPICPSHPISKAKHRCLTRRPPSPALSAFLLLTHSCICLFWQTPPPFPSVCAGLLGEGVGSLMRGCAPHPGTAGGALLGHFLSPFHPQGSLWPMNSSVFPYRAELHVAL